jgi:MbtH protein
VSDKTDSEERYVVVINQDEQYSIWRAHLEIPEGWTRVGEEGSKESCLKFIGKTWTDMRPLNLRR